MELTDILGGADAPVEPVSTVEPPAADTPPAEAPATTAEAPTSPRDERGRFTRQEPEASAVEIPPEPAPEKRQPHMVPVEAMLDERRKRQELEARLAAQQPLPDVKDEDYWTTPIDATRKVARSEMAPLEAQIREVKYAMAEELTKTLHNDFDQVKQEFVKRVVSDDPWAIAIAQQLDRQTNPAKFMYDAYKRLSMVDQVGDLSSYEARIRAEERARVLAEVQQSQQQRPPPVDVPRSLNSETSAPSPSTPAGFEPTPLGNLLPNTF